MGLPFKSHLATRQVAQLGTPAVLTTYAVASQDSHGDDQHTSTDYDITVVLSQITNTREPFDRSGPLGHYYNMHVEFFTADTLPSNLNDPTAEPATMTHGGHSYTIMDFENAQNGLQRLICYRKRV